ncbi:MAG: alpha/beta hydrolase [Deltaproteobacteria bacterium]|nr:alpha/beta hydrolase [Deltaproteobacteria bacterium]
MKSYSIYPFKMKPSHFTTSKIAIYEQGVGYPVLVLPGGPGLSSKIYRDCLAPLSKHLVFFDYRGTGASHDPKAYGVEKDYSDTLEVIEAAKLKHFAIIAHSYGGLHALRLALTFPDRINKLLLVAAFAGPSVFVGLGKRIAPVLGKDKTTRLKECEKQFKKRTNPSAARIVEYINLISLFHFKEPTTEKTQALCKPGVYNAAIEFANSDWMNIDLRSQLSQIKAETLIVCGQHDRMVPPETGEEFLAIPNAKMLTITNSGHWPFWEQPDQFLSVAENFL